MASTMRRRWRKPTSASPWVRGTDVAMESAGVTLVKGDLRGIARAAVLSRATMRNIRQNLAFAFGYNALGIPRCRRRALSRFRFAAIAGLRRCCHGAELGLRGHQRLASESRQGM